MRVEKANFKEIEEVSVTFGERAASVMRIVDRITIEVVVPSLPPGEVEVVVRLKGAVIGTGRAAIAPAPMMRVFFQMTGDSIALRKIRPFNGRYDRSVQKGRRLSYDVVAPDGELLFTAAIAHPATGTIEIYGPPDERRPRRLPAAEPYRFAVKIPYTESRVALRIYDVPDGLDIDTARGRAQRRLIREVEIGNGEER